LFAINRVQPLVNRCRCLPLFAINRVTKNKTKNFIFHVAVAVVFVFVFVPMKSLEPFPQSADPFGAIALYYLVKRQTPKRHNGAIRQRRPQLCRYPISPLFVFCRMSNDNAHAVCCSNRNKNKIKLIQTLD